MADSLNPTFFAFRKRERGGVLLRASLAYAVLAFAVSGVFLYLNWQAFLDYWNWSVALGQSTENVDPNDPSAVFASMMPPASVMAIAPAYTIVMFLTYFLFAMYEAACLRWMIRGEVKGFFGLALDADTMRVYFTYWLWLFLLIAVYIVSFIVLFGFGVGVAMTAGQNSDAGTVGASLLIGLLVVLAIFLGVIYFAVRFAPAAATSIARRRFAFFEAWSVTKGRFWSLFGAFLLLFVMYFVGIILLTVIAGVAMGVGMFGVLQAAAEPESLEQVLAIFASPAVWVPALSCYALMIAGVFLFYIALFGINARAALAALDEGKIRAAE